MVLCFNNGVGCKLSIISGPLNYYNIKITLECNVAFVLITSLINSLLHISYVGRGNLGIDMPP